MDNNHRSRILHVINSMNPGGIENWLMNLLRVNDKDLFQVDFLVHTTKSGAYDKEILSLGSNILRSPWHKRPFKYSREIKRLINKHGPYNVIHSHVHHFSGWVLRSAFHAGIPIRISHSHSNITELISRSGWIRKAYYIYMKYLVRKYASIGIACSNQSAKSLFGSKWKTDPRWRIVYCGIDVDLFKKSVEKSSIRKQLGIPSDSVVVGHVGRFHEDKNHAFIIDIFSEIIRNDSSVYLLLVGDGGGLINIKKLVQAKGLHNKIIFSGLRNDINELMIGAMDIFLFPSLREGMGLAIIEAQAAGLPCVLSEHIPHEADIIPSLIYRIPLSKGAKEWAKLIIDIHKMKRGEGTSNNKFFQIVLNSPFNLKVGKLKLEKIYGQEYY